MAYACLLETCGAFKQTKQLPDAQHGHLHMNNSIHSKPNPVACKMSERRKFCTAPSCCEPMFTCMMVSHDWAAHDSIKSHDRCRPEKEAHQLAVRQKVRQAIMAGRVTDAQELLHQCNPDMLESVTHPNLDVLIFFHCLHYIELIR